MAQIFATQRSVKAKAKQNQKRPKSLRRHQQPTIIQSLASVSRQASSQSRSSLRKLSDTKTKPRNLTIDELFGMGSGWLSDTESDPPGSGESGSHSAHSPQCNASSSLSSPSGSVSVAGVASRPRNIVSPDVLLSPPSYLTPPLGEEEGDWDRDSGYRTINTGLHSPNDQRQKNQGSIKKLNSFVKCKLNSTSLTKYTAKHTIDSGSGSSEEDDNLPTYTLREPPTSSPNSEREERGKMNTSKTDPKAPCVVDLDDQERLFLDTLQTHSNTGSPDSQPLGDITNITFPDVFQTTDCPQSMEKKMHSHSQQSEDSHTALANESPTHLESNNSSGDHIDLTGDCSIVVLSDSEGVSTSQLSTHHPHNAEGNRKVVGRGKKRIISPRTLFKGANELCDVPELRIKRWMCQSKPLLVEIFQRKVYSRRHESFITSAKNRALLQWQISTRLFSKGQVDVITDCLMKCFCYKDMDYFSYVMSVLYPECLVRLIMDFYSIPFDEAEKKMMGLHEDTEDADSDV